MDGENPVQFSPSLEENITRFKTAFVDDETLVIRYVENRSNPKIRFCLFYIDGMVNNRLINNDLIKPIEEFDGALLQNSVIDTLSKKIVFANQVETAEDLTAALTKIVYGDTVLVADGENKALILNSKGWTIRGITEPESEKNIRGPREGFVEAILTNIAMVRRRILNTDLKFKFMFFGTRTKTKVCICYLDSLVDKNVLAELNKRLQSISIDGALDANYIAEFIADNRYTPVKTVGSTERPDIVAAKLLEGRVALFVDGTPMVLTLPYLFIENFQSSDDYYLNYWFSSISRILRLIAFVISIGMPAFYVAITTYHQEFLPGKMLLSISLARQGVPFPTIVETILMLTVFEILREAGTRMPQAVGQTLSIVGVLVVGQAAVEARIISAPMIIVIAITGISGVMLFKLKGMIIVLRIILLTLVCMVGLYGLMFGILALIIHLYSLNSFGVPIISDIGSAKAIKHKDIEFRAPWWTMKKRPVGLSSDEIRESGR